MTITKNELQSKIFHLLQAWCDELIHLQISMPGNTDFDGAILCPACKVIHGRCHDAIYPMMYMADATGDQKYLDAAKKLFRWGENMLCDDGGLYNDAQSTWNGITVFNAVSLCDALKKHGHLLDANGKRACFGWATGCLKTSGLACARTSTISPPTATPWRCWAITSTGTITVSWRTSSRIIA